MSQELFGKECSTIALVRLQRPLPVAGPTVAGDSRYVEVVYGAVLGPSATMIYRRLYWILGIGDGPICIEVAELARGIGVKPTIARRSLQRIVDFRFAQTLDKEFALRVEIPPASPRVLCRLSPSAIDFHTATLRSTKASRS